MSYRNKTYVIFDGDEDMWSYGFMKGWNQSEHIDFNFYDAHELNDLTAVLNLNRNRLVDFGRGILRLV